MPGVSIWGKKMKVGSLCDHTSCNRLKIENIQERILTSSGFLGYSERVWKY